MPEQGGDFDVAAAFAAAHEAQDGGVPRYALIGSELKPLGDLDWPTINSAWDGQVPTFTLAELRALAAQAEILDTLGQPTPDDPSSLF